jgi:hypothetical protein
MKFGTIFIALAITEVLLFLFGYINQNSLIGIFFGAGDIKNFLSLTNLLDATNLILSITAIVGIVTKNQYMIFGSLTLFLLDTVFGITGVIGYFPAPFGHILFGILSLIFVWLALEWWRQNEN